MNVEHAFIQRHERVKDRERMCERKKDAVTSQS